MILDFIGAFAAGLGLLACVFVLDRLTGRRMGRWVMPASVAIGMIVYTAWAEYTWADRTISAQPQLRLASTTDERVFYRPWTYIVPQVNRMIAVDLSQTRVHPDQPALVMTDLVLMGRWEPVHRVPVIFNCDDNTRMDLVDGVTLQSDGTVEGGRWEPMAEGDRVLTTACTAAEEIRNGTTSS